jgi:hypothetical protein
VCARQQGKTLGVAALEDKIVQQAIHAVSMAREVLEQRPSFSPIYQAPQLSGWTKDGHLCELQSKERKQAQK